MRQTKYGLQLIEVSDRIDDLPGQFNNNVEMMIERFDWMSECIGRIQNELNMMKKDRPEVREE